MAGKPECAGKSNERDRAERVFLTAVAAAEDGTCPLGTHLAAVCLLSHVWKVPANKPSA